MWSFLFSMLLVLQSLLPRESMETNAQLSAKQPNSMECTENANCMSDCCIYDENIKGSCQGIPDQGQVCGLPVKNSVLPYSLQNKGLLEHIKFQKAYKASLENNTETSPSTAHAKHGSLQPNTGLTNGQLDSSNKMSSTNQASGNSPLAQTLLGAGLTSQNLPLSNQGLATDQSLLQKLLMAQYGLQEQQQQQLQLQKHDKQQPQLEQERFGNLQLPGFGQQQLQQQTQQPTKQRLNQLKLLQLSQQLHQQQPNQKQLTAEQQLIQAQLQLKQLLEQNNAILSKRPHLPGVKTTGPGSMFNTQQQEFTSLQIPHDIPATRNRQRQQKLQNLELYRSTDNRVVPGILPNFNRQHAKPEAQLNPVYLAALKGIENYLPTTRDVLTDKKYRIADLRQPRLRALLEQRADALKRLGTLTLLNRMQQARGQAIKSSVDSKTWQKLKTNNYNQNGIYDGYQSNINRNAFRSNADSFDYGKIGTGRKVSGTSYSGHDFGQFNLG